MKIAIGCDHGGIVLKDAIKARLDKLGVEFEDFGTFGTESVDYPDYAFKVGSAVADGRFDKGILLCGTGIGISIAANKVGGVRAAVCHDLNTASLAAEHNAANILCMGGRVVSPELAADMTEKWLATPFGEGRHARRVDKISRIEEFGRVKQ